MEKQRRRSRLTIEEARARARDAERRRIAREQKRQTASLEAERRRIARQQKQHAASLEAAIADLADAPNRIGARAEDRAVDALEADGYVIVERNWSRDLGELDIVARDGAVLVFVEVRSRDDDAHGHAAEMVSRAKQRKVTNVAQVYLAVERPAYEQCRFDVVAVTGDSIEIIKDAWRN